MTKKNISSLPSPADNRAVSPATIVHRPESQSASLAGSPEGTPTSPEGTRQDFSVSTPDHLEDSPASPADYLEDEPVSPPPVAKDAKYTAFASPRKQKVWQRLFALSKGREQNSPQEDLTLLR